MGRLLIFVCRWHHEAIADADLPALTEKGDRLQRIWPVSPTFNWPLAPPIVRAELSDIMPGSAPSPGEVDATSFRS
jgi:hypothetical protein